MSFICPICQDALRLIQTPPTSCYQCGQGHQFDVAKEGYVHLLPVQHKHSKLPGDSAEMMQARRAFLATDHYLPLRDAISEQIANQALSTQSQAAQALESPQITKQNDEHSESSQKFQVLDLGCGEGYYTNGFADKLAQLPFEYLEHVQHQVFGLDISKVAIRYGAKRYPACRFTVASSYRAPFADDSFDVICKIYAPSDANELHRLLKPSGIFIDVTPANRHLYQIRELIYQDVRDHQEKHPEGFTLIDEQRLTYTHLLNSVDLANLVQMTPFAWKATTALKQVIEKVDEFKCDFDFMIRVYQTQLVIE